MAILTDRDILNADIIERPSRAKVSTHHILGTKIMSYGLEPHGYTMTMKEPTNTLALYTESGENGRKYVYLDTGKSMMVTCNEKLTMPNDVVGFLYPKSSYSRHGLIYSLAVVDAGFSGHISFSMFNGSDTWHKIYIDEGILQIIFHRSNARPESVYSGQYNEV